MIADDVIRGTPPVNHRPTTARLPPESEGGPATVFPRADQGGRSVAPGKLSHVLVCVDRSGSAGRLIEHAAAIANIYSARVTLIHSLEPSGTSSAPAPTDAVDWRLRHQEAQGFLESAASAPACRGLRVATELAEGRAYRQICTWIQCHDVDLTVASTHDEGNREDHCLGATARKLLEGLRGSLFLIPTAGTDARSSEKLRYKQILVPLDGSPHAESVLPLARELAIAHRSELLLAHVVPAPEIMRVGLPTVADAELAESVTARNTELATNYLESVRAQLAGPNLRVRTCLRRRASPRDEILRMTETESVDLLLLSAHGCTGATHRAMGNVALHLVTYARVPTLLSRRRSIGKREGAHASVREDRGDLRLSSTLLA